MFLSTNSNISAFSKISVAELRKIIQVKNERKLSKLNKLVLWLNYAVIVSLIIASLAKYVSPQLFWIIAFFGLAFPFIYLLNLIFAIYWLVQFRRLFAFSAVAAVLTLSTAFKYLQFNFSGSTSPEKCFKITSYNSMLFDLYNWFHNTETRNKIFTNLSEIDSDIICFQEFYTSEEPGDFNNIDSLTKLLNLPYHHAEYTTTLREHDHWGVATFSRFPIIHKGKIVFETKNNNLCIYTDMIINKDTVRVYNLHLQSISFSKKDNLFLDDLKKGNESDEDLEKSKNILRRLKRAFVKRAKQVEIIKLHMSTCKYKMILCGDFNDTPASYTYAQLSSELKDAFVSKGKGLGKTYAGKWPQFRIDYILYDKRFKCEQFERSDETFTDHYPITAFIH